MSSPSTIGQNHAHKTSDSTTTGTTTGTNKNFKSQFIELIKSKQFPWFIGHLMTITLEVVYLMSLRIFSKNWTNLILYRLIYVAVLLSYMSVLSQSGIRLKNYEMIYDDNWQYAAFLFLLLISPTSYSLSTVPFCVFAMFHSLNYIKLVLVPILDENFPSYKKIWNKIVKGSDWVVLNCREKLMKMSALIEVFNLVVVGIWSVFNWRSWWLLILYSVFIKLRYQNSIYTRTIFSKAEVQIDGLVSHPKVPVQVKKCWMIIKSRVKLLGKYDLRKTIAGDSTTTTNTPGASNFGQNDEKKMK